MHSGASRPNLRTAIVADQTPPASERIRLVYSIDNMGTGGTELNAVRTAERIDRSRFDLSVICLTDDGGPMLARYARAGVPVVHFPIHNLYGPDSVRQGLRLARYLRRERADVVHSHDVYSSIFTTCYARAAGVPGVVASRRFLRFPESRERLLRAASRVTYKVAHRVLTNSATVGRRLWELEGVNQRNVIVMPNFVDDECFEPASPAWVASMRRELALPDGAPVVGIVARLAAVKDHATLLRAFAQVAGLAVAPRLVIVGEGPLASELETLAASLGVRDRVHFAGLRPNVPNLHELFDLSVLSSTSEGFPNSIVEAMAAGRAVVATSVGGNVDAVADGRTGLLVPSGDPAAMATAITTLLADAPRREAMGRAALARAREEFGASRVLAMLQRTYEELAGRRALVAPAA